MEAETIEGNTQQESVMTRRKLLTKLAEAEHLLSTQTLPAHDAGIAAADEAAKTAEKVLHDALRQLPIAKEAAGLARAAKTAAIAAFDRDRREFHTLLRAKPLTCVDEWTKTLRTDLRRVQDELSALSGFAGTHISRQVWALEKKVALINALIKAAADLQVTCAEADAPNRIEELKHSVPALIDAEFKERERFVSR